MRTVTPKKARLIPKEAECVFKGVIFDVYQWRQEKFDGSFATYEMIKRPDTVNVLAIKGERLVIIRDEQPSRPVVVTLPGGRHDVASETELDCAKREMHEETGMRFKNWKLISVKQEHAKIEYFYYIFLATDFEGQDEPHVDAGGEKIEVSEVTLDELKQQAEAQHNGYLPYELLRDVHSLDDVRALPEIK
jgi:ADP-ribose pyrophosphatase YjhB (NUDIX family)